MILFALTNKNMLFNWGTPWRDACCCSCGETAPTSRASSLVEPDLYHHHHHKKPHLSLRKSLSISRFFAGNGLVLRCLILYRSAVVLRCLILCRYALVLRISRFFAGIG